MTIEQEIKLSILLDIIEFKEHVITFYWEKLTPEYLQQQERKIKLKNLQKIMDNIK